MVIRVALALICVVHVSSISFPRFSSPFRKPKDAESSSESPQIQTSPAPSPSPSEQRSSIETQLQALRSAAEKKLKGEVESGLSWYITQGAEKNVTFCDSKTPTYEDFKNAPPQEQKKFLLKACLSGESPIVKTKLCEAFRVSLAEELKDKVVASYKRMGRFLFFELPLLKAAYQFTSVNLARLLGLKRRVAVVRFEGSIGSGQGVDVRCVDALEEAFKWRPAAVFLEINSGGGSPVQSSTIYRRLRKLRERYPKTPLVVVVEDVCASGAFYIACAADEILCDPSSIVGSVGVVRADFGFHKVLGKYGVERRVLTSGANKVSLDPYQAATPADVAKQANLMAELHDEFIACVVQGRGGKLNGTLARLLADAGDAGLKLTNLDAAKATAHAVAATATTTGTGAGDAARGANKNSTAPWACQVAESKWWKRFLRRGDDGETSDYDLLPPPGVVESEASAKRKQAGEENEEEHGADGAEEHAAAKLEEAEERERKTGGFAAGAVEAAVAERFSSAALKGGEGAAKAALAQAANAERAKKEAKAFSVDATSKPALDKRGLFDGSVYSGRTAVEVGFADGFGNTIQTARQRYGENVELRRYVAIRRPDYTLVRHAPISAAPLSLPTHTEVAFFLAYAAFATASSSTAANGSRPSTGLAAPASAAAALSASRFPGATRGLSAALGAAAAAAAAAAGAGALLGGGGGGHCSEGGCEGKNVWASPSPLEPSDSEHLASLWSRAVPKPGSTEGAATAAEGALPSFSFLATTDGGMPSFLLLR